MDTHEIVEGIESSQCLDPGREAAAHADIKYIIFSAGSGLYALAADDVQEIMLEMDVHYLPFTPPFVRGLINRLGEPLTVIDLVNLLHGQRLQGKAFIILKPHISKMAFMIDAVQDIVRVDSSAIRHVARGAQESGAYVTGIFTQKTGDVTILALKEIITAVRNAVDAQS